MNSPTIFLFVLSVASLTYASESAKSLYHDLMGNYSKLTRPVRNDSEQLVVLLGLKLSQLIGIDEKNQIMITNVWVYQRWQDCYLKWDPKDYGGIDYLYIPAADIWTPEVVLYNNADGSFQGAHSTKATAYYNGTVVWEPPAIYQSSCGINVEFFPFDEQECPMTFSSWTYHYGQVDLRHLQQANDCGDLKGSISHAIDMDEYYGSFIWDVMDVSAVRNISKGNQQDKTVYPDITFHVVLRRKTLFYTVNLIIPCVAISCLTILVFYLPSDSGEKITFSISILLALTLFILLLNEIIPPTSLVVPLIGKYLVFTMFLIIFSICMTVVSLNLHSRSSSTHVMSDWMRRIFIDKLPRFIYMERPRVKNSQLHPDEAPINDCNGHRLKDLRGSMRQKSAKYDDSQIEISDCGTNGSGFDTPRSSRSHLCKNGDGDDNLSLKNQMFDNIKAIADHLKAEDYDNQVIEDWKYISLVFDRLFLWISASLCLIGSCSIILYAPTIYDGKQPLEH